MSESLRLDLRCEPGQRLPSGLLDRSCLRQAHRYTSLSDRCRCRGGCRCHRERDSGLGSRSNRDQDRFIHDKGSYIVRLNRSTVEDPIYIDAIHVFLVRAEEHVLWELILIQRKGNIQELDVPRVGDSHLDLLTRDAGGYIPARNRNDDRVPDDVRRLVCVGIVQIGHILSSTGCGAEQNREDDEEAEDPTE